MAATDGPGKWPGAAGRKQSGGEGPPQQTGVKAWGVRSAQADGSGNRGSARDKERLGERKGVRKRAGPRDGGGGA